MEKVPKRYNLITITLWCAFMAPILFESFNWLTAIVLIKHGVMERWPIFVYIASAFIAGGIIQQLEYVKPDLLMRLFLMMCWIFVFFVSLLFWESLLQGIPQGMDAVKMLIVLPTAITGLCFFLGLSIRRISPEL